MRTIYHMSQWNITASLCRFVPYCSRTLLSDGSAAGLHTCRPGEGGIINSQERTHGPGGLPAIRPNRWVSVWYPVEYMGLIRRRPLDLSIFGKHHRSLRLICILTDWFVLGLLRDWASRRAPKLLEGVPLKVSVHDERLVSHQKPRVHTSQKADKVDVIIIFRLLSRGQH